MLMGVTGLGLDATHEGLGYLLGVSDSTVSRDVQRVVKVLEAASQDAMRMPDPGRKRPRSLDALLKDTPELAVVIDSFEQKVQRPAQKAGPDALWHGKKKMHTLKSQVSVDQQTGAIVMFPTASQDPWPLSSWSNTPVCLSACLLAWGLSATVATRVSMTCTLWPIRPAKSRVVKSVRPKM